MEVALSLISAVTDAVIEDVKEWQSRLLEALYPILFLKCADGEDPARGAGGEPRHVRGCGR